MSARVDSDNDRVVRLMDPLEIPPKICTDLVKSFDNAYERAWIRIERLSVFLQCGCTLHRNALILIIVEEP